MHGPRLAPASLPSPQGCASNRLSSKITVVHLTSLPRQSYCDWFTKKPMWAVGLSWPPCAFTRLLWPLSRMPTMLPFLLSFLPMMQLPRLR